jgi:hypothetical protein
MSHIQLQGLGLLTFSDLQVGQNDPSICLVADLSLPLPLGLYSYSVGGIRSVQIKDEMDGVRNADTIFVDKYEGKRQVKRGWG